jgi:hypothetical protein
MELSFGDTAEERGWGRPIDRDLMCRRKIQMSPGVQSRNDTPTRRLAEDTTGRHWMTAKGWPRRTTSGIARMLADPTKLTTVDRSEVDECI